MAKKKLKKIEDLTHPDEKYIGNLIKKAKVPYTIDTEEMGSGATVTNFVVENEAKSDKVIFTCVTRNGETDFDFDEDLIKEELKSFYHDKKLSQEFKDYLAYKDTNSSHSASKLSLSDFASGAPKWRKKNGAIVWASDTSYRIYLSEGFVNLVVTNYNGKVIKEANNIKYPKIISEIKSDKTLNAQDWKEAKTLFQELLLSEYGVK